MLSNTVCINYHNLYIENKLKYNNIFISRGNICKYRWTAIDNTKRNMR